MSLFSEAQNVGSCLSPEHAHDAGTPNQSRERKRAVSVARRTAPLRSRL